MTTQGQRAIEWQQTPSGPASLFKLPRRSAIATPCCCGSFLNCTSPPACAAYLRYVDDLYLLGDSQAGLWCLRDRLAVRLKALGLEIHPRKCPLQPSTQRVDILGYQVSPRQRWLRNDNGYRAQRRLKRLAARYWQGRRGPRAITAFPALPSMSPWSPAPCAVGRWRLRESRSRCLRPSSQA